VQPDVDAGMLFEQREEGIIGLFVALLKNVFEITGWLVGMYDRDEMEGGTGLRHDVPRP
jgi:hypothetical protein